MYFRVAWLGDQYRSPDMHHPGCPSNLRNYMLVGSGIVSGFIFIFKQPIALAGTYKFCYSVLCCCMIGINHRVEATLSRNEDSAKSLQGLVASLVVAQAWISHRIRQRSPFVFIIILILLFILLVR